MDALCIRYAPHPSRLPHFKTDVEHKLEAIRNAGGRIVGYQPLSLDPDLAEAALG